MKHSWNVDPTSPITILRLLSELEGVSVLLNCLDETDDLECINVMKRKYYKEYFRREKEERNKS